MDASNIANLKSKKVYALLDCDSFFASCEVFRNPSLIGKPVCIGVDIVVACTYEAKAYGIRTGTPVWEAKRILGKRGLFLVPDISFYSSVSQRLMGYLANIVNGMDIFSIDEAFLDITGLDEVYGVSYEQFVEELKVDIRKSIGIPVSIGVSRTKLIAKIFAKLNKPYGTFVCLEEEKIDEIFHQIGFGEIPFIGKSSYDCFKYVCKTVYDFKYMEYDKIKKYLKGSGIKLWYELNMVDIISFGHNEYPKGIMRSRSFNPDFTSDREIVWKRLMGNFEKAFEELIYLDMKLRYLKIFFRKKDFSRFAVDIYFPSHTNDKTLLLDYMKKMFNSIFDDRVIYRSTGVIFGDLKKTADVPRSLFETDKQSNKDKLRKIINDVNERFGGHVIGCANGFKKKEKIDNFMGIVS